MTDTDELSARLEAVLTRLEQQVGPGVTPFTYSIPPVHVAAGELIESAWGNSVVDTLAVQAAHSSYNAADAIQAGPLIQTRYQALTTDPAGFVTAGFRYPFASQPGVVVCGAEPGLNHVFTISSATTTQFVALVRNATTGAVAASVATALAYIAIGPRL